MMSNRKEVKSKKTLAISAICFPPVLIGPAILMGNLFKHFPEGSYHVLMGRLDHVWRPIDENSALPAPYTFTRFPFLHSRGNWRHRIRSLLRDIFSLLEVNWKGLRIIQWEKINSIFVVADHYVELAALLMSRLTGKKLVLYLPDVYYVPENLKGWAKFTDRMIEPFLLRAVDTVLVTGEPTQEYYNNKYGLETVVLPHSTDMSKYDFHSEESHTDEKPTKILFTGSVEPCNYGPIIDLVKVVSEHLELNLELNIVSNKLSKEIEEVCGRTARITCGHASREEIPALQQSADILFLALSFDEHGYNYPTIVRTASPSKLPEYLAAGRPILVYAPKESYYARYARKGGFALVVEKPDIEQLRQAVQTLQRDKALRQRLVSNAYRFAKQHHDSRKVSVQLQNLLGIDKE